MTKREFIERLVFERGVHPESAFVTWKEFNDVLLRDWQPNPKTDSGSILEPMIPLMDALSPGARTTVIALLRERYDEKTGQLR